MCDFLRFTLFRGFLCTRSTYATLTLLLGTSSKPGVLLRLPVFWILSLSKLSSLVCMGLCILRNFGVRILRDFFGIGAL
jgi:hypothetical protein